MNKQIISKKWKKLLKSAKGFRYIPFIDFVLVSGSMATGEVHEESDFDVIVGVKKNRMFTVRQLIAGFFSLINKRRKKSDQKSESKNKFCFNHFVTSNKYRLDPPHNEYWVYLYQNLIPIYGSKEHIEDFFNLNNWAGEININYGYLIEKDSFWKKIFEVILSNWFGDIVEKIFKKYQLKRINKGLEKNMGYKPQIKIGDDELRFHMDTKRIEEWIKNKK